MSDSRHRVKAERALAAVALATALLGAPPAARAQGGADVPAAETLVHATATPVQVAAGSRGQLSVHIEVREGWHVNANPPALDYNIPTRVTLQAEDGLTAGAPRYPKGSARKFAFESTLLLVYDQAADVAVPLIA